MSEKSLAISCVAAAIVCGTFFYPDPPVSAAARAQPAPAKSVADPPVSAAARAQPAPAKSVAAAATAKVTLSSLDAPAIASNAAKVSHAATPATRDWGNRIAAVSK
jgi:hypothetical protein